MGGKAVAGSFSTYPITGIAERCCRNGLLAVCHADRQDRSVAAVEMQQVEGIKDQAHAARPNGRGLGRSEVRKAVVADAA